MRDNPIYSLSKRRLREYQKIIRLYGEYVRKMFTKYRATPFNQKFLQRWLLNVADNLSSDTRRLIIAAVDDVIDKTLHTYNKMHKGDKLTDDELKELHLEIRKEFLLSKFKDRTLDQRISQAEKRLKVNLLREHQNLILANAEGLYPIENLIYSITGKEYKEGGTALRWNSRLVLSEMYRAYQFSARVILARLGVKEVRWVNSPRHEPNGSVIDEYAERIYSPKELPEYPYPCNDSYFIPIY